MNNLIGYIIFAVLLAKVSLAVLLLLFWRFYFLRNPKRKVPAGSNIVSPADGKIIDIFEPHKSQIKIKKHFGIIKTLTEDVAKKCWIISIFMSPFDVHYNRAPIDGKVISVNHSKGKFLAAHRLDALANEKNEVLIKTKIGKIKVIQIAGLIARRIECFVKPGQKVKKGERFGLINLGSQAVLIVPKRNIKILVNKNQRVKGGLTVLAEIR